MSDEEIRWCPYCIAGEIPRERVAAVRHLPEHEQGLSTRGSIHTPMMRSAYRVRSKGVGPDDEPAGDYQKFRCGRCGYSESEFRPL